MTLKNIVSSPARSRCGDVVIGSRTFEVTSHVRGSRQLYRALGDGYFGVILGGHNNEPLLVVRLGDFLRQCAFRDPGQEQMTEQFPDSQLHTLKRHEQIVGTRRGRPPLNIPKSQLADLHRERLSIGEISRRLGVSRATIRRRLREVSA